MLLPKSDAMLAWLFCIGLGVLVVLLPPAPDWSVARGVLIEDVDVRRVPGAVEEMSAQSCEAPGMLLSAMLYFRGAARKFPGEWR